MNTIVFRVVRSIPALGLVAGDDVVFDRRGPRPFTRLSSVDPSAAVHLYVDGALAPLTPAPPPTELAAAVGIALPPGADPRRPVRRGPLTLVPG